MAVASAAFAAGSPIPRRHACDGESLSPPLAWRAPPAGTWYLWAISDIPAELGALAEGLPATTATGACRRGPNDFGQTGYGGICSPAARPKRATSGPAGGG